MAANQLNTQVCYSSSSKTILAPMNKTNLFSRCQKSWAAPGKRYTYSSHHPKTSSNQQQQARLAQSVARETLNLKVVGSSPTSGFKQFFFAKGCPWAVGGGGVGGLKIFE
jgi:hypothetical protein